MEPLDKYIGYGLALGTGITFKLTDDYMDKFKIPNDSFPMEISKILLVMFSTLLLLQDVWFTIMICFFTIGCYFVNSMSENFWKAAVSLLVIITPYMLYTHSLGNSFTILLYSFIVFCGFVLSILEAKSFPEEVSTEKLLTRFVVVLIFILYLFFDIPEFLHDIFPQNIMEVLHHVKDLYFLNLCLYGVIGYFGTSLVNSHLFTSSSDLEKIE
jgi:hypothetical protein